MTLDLLDLLLVAQFCFNRDVPEWLWVLGVVANISAYLSKERLVKTFVSAIREHT